jgi:hypothetical protein
MLVRSSFEHPRSDPISYRIGVQTRTSRNFNAYENAGTSARLSLLDKTTTSIQFISRPEEGVASTNVQHLEDFRRRKRRISRSIRRGASLQCLLLRKYSPPCRKQGATKSGFKGATQHDSLRSTDDSLSPFFLPADA